MVCMAKEMEKPELAGFLNWNIQIQGQMLHTWSCICSRDDLRITYRSPRIVPHQRNDIGTSCGDF
jgi:hypothetical protein